MKILRSIYAPLLCGTLLGAASGVAMSGEPAPAATGAPSALEEIVVSARKREETLISVPVVITAVSAATLETRGIANLDSLARIVPQLLIGNQSGSVQGGNISIRGIAGPDSNPFGDQAVSFNIDGVQIAKAFVRRMTDTDIEQVEVLKGPQALFFGKNSPAGIVSYRTADPTKEFKGKVTVGYEPEASEALTSGFLSGPLSDTLGARVAYAYSNMRGYLDEATPKTSPWASTDSRNPNAKNYAVRGTLKWDPNDVFSARAKLNYGETQTNGPAATTQFISCPFGVRQTGSGLPCGNGDYSVNASNGPVVGTIPGTLNSFGNGQNFQDQRQFLGSLEMDYHLSSTLLLTSVTGMYNTKLDQCQNYENDPGIILPSCNPTTDREFSQEFRVTSDFKGPLNFSAGLFYADTKAHSGSITYLFGGGFDLLGPGFGGPTTPALINDYDLIQVGKAYSAYLQGIYKPIDTVEIDLGGRYSYEKKTMVDVRDGGGLSEAAQGSCFTTLIPCTAILDNSTILSPPAGLSKHWNDFSPEATISYRPTQNLTLFASYKRGFLSGGFNSSSVNFRANPDISYDPEKIKGEEIGVKSLLFDGTLSVNAAAYEYKVTDLQVTNFTNATSTIKNAGAVKIDGAEGDFNWKTPLEGLNMHGAVAYNNGKYTSFVGAPCYNGETTTLGCRQNAAGNAVQDLSNTELIRAPKVNASFGLGYETALNGSLKIYLSGDVTHSSDFLTDATSAPQSRQPSFTLLDSTVRLSDANDVWQVAFIGRNLSNKHYWVASPNVPFTGTTSSGLVADDPKQVLGDRFAGVSRGREYLCLLYTSDAADE